MRKLIEIYLFVYKSVESQIRALYVCQILDSKFGIVLALKNLLSTKIYNLIVNPQNKILHEVLLIKMNSEREIIKSFKLRWNIYYLLHNK